MSQLALQELLEVVHLSSAPHPLRVTQCAVPVQTAQEHLKVIARLERIEDIAGLVKVIQFVLLS